MNTTDEVVADAVRVAQNAGHVHEGDTIVLTAGMVGGIRNATNLMMVRAIERVVARGIGLGQREVAGKVVRIRLPLNGELPLVGPQDILFADRIDRSCLPLLQRAGGLITSETGLDSLGAVLAMELGLPAIIGIDGHVEELVDGAPVVMNTTNGLVSQWKKSMPITRNDDRR